MDETLREYHEYANLFPIMQGDDFDVLKEDILSNGLIDPIWLCDEKIIDGRNRHMACLETNTPLKFRIYEGNDPLGFVISTNLHRRHLNETQRAGVAAKIANMERGNFSKSANLQDSPVSIPQAAEMLNVGERTVATYKAVAAAAPEFVEKMDSGEMTAHAAQKEVKKKMRDEERDKIANAGASVPVSDRWNIYHGDINDIALDKQYDFIITDPPYPREYLPLYEVLSMRANEWLKPEGLLIAMCGQSYLNEIYELMESHMNYYWTACYLTPGQATSLWQKQINTNWKPLLIYSKEKYNGKTFGDVFKSDDNEKDYHKWGQSVSGMLSIIKQICLPGQSILDPFCGAGTTGIAALQHGCLFDGIDIEIDNVNISKKRIDDTTTA